MTATRTKVLKFWDGGKGKISTLPIERGTIVDNRDRERFKVGEQSIPYRHRNWLGITVIDRMFFVRAGIGDTMPLEIEDLSKAKFTSKADAELMEDQAIFEAIQETRTGSQEPLATKFLGAGMLIMFIVDAIIAVVWLNTASGGIF